MQLAMLADPVRAHLVVRGHPIGQGCVGPPAWRCWMDGVGKPAKLWRKDAGLCGCRRAGGWTDESTFGL